ncbi:YdeI/OmpD-associated family protein [Neobacillus mesonae]|uniref:YdeI/OmpD-associated family protein n=1 Tax=Neobacillus mesonae TaxID=1193713 RepID=UPI002040DF81|nr:YdeI/OmpD-associated family protein [Neobacillus mesonae]MCM3568636.1 YdeI/OmpD-associated family protein [Neobacillus mesonae]
MAKTIVEKLNLQKYKKAAVINLPDGADYFTDLKEYDSKLTGPSYDLVFAFVLDMEQLKTLVNKIIREQYLNKNGYIYLAYPKKGNKEYPTFIHRDDLFGGLGADEEGYIANSTLKFSRMVGLDDVFTVVGLKESAKSNTSAAKRSQKVSDYEAMIPEIEKELRDTPEILIFYQSLTPGYRKDWARYVYSAKQEATREKRRNEMKKILGAGFKTRDLFLKSKS